MLTRPEMGEDASQLNEDSNGDDGDYGDFGDDGDYGDVPNDGNDDGGTFELEGTEDFREDDHDDVDLFSESAKNIISETNLTVLNSDGQLGATALDYDYEIKKMCELFGNFIEVLRGYQRDGRDEDFRQCARSFEKYMQHGITVSSKNGLRMRNT
ncbi:uncharacterized protein KGF55_004088 [Candida pseudojiufengensis]|uniref:uncharacterized protein n=1 Tax=Candida pseudojiufengensis TaxID=497109 RepID=UPI002225263E|nr:uncharacterized protein KGF55_004088 [Candida pseudojiufengensis]KAI5961163.1 hypothetical protein KGF55_004088 [Candida pseudojiufengensis]